MSRFATQTIPGQTVPAGTWNRTKTFTYFSQSASAWTAPPYWLQLPTVASTEQKIVFLFAVKSASALNKVGFTLTVVTGSYTVDWGDGTASQKYVTGNTASYGYNFDTLSASVNPEGNKQVVVTVTPTALNGQFKTIDFSTVVDTVQTGGNGSSVGSMPIESLIISAPNCTNILFTPVGGGNRHYLRDLQNFELRSTTASFTNYSNFFGAMPNVRNIYLHPELTPTGASYMFSLLNNLEIAPFFNTACINNATLMFQSCVNLKSVPDYDFSNCLTFNQMFYLCYSLETSPKLKTSTRLNNVNQMFDNCLNLRTVNLFDTSSVTLFSSMFNQCQSLKTVPAFQTGAASNTAAMFANCAVLEFVPNFSTACVTSFTQMFISCWNLKTAPLMDTSKGLGFSSMFSNCYALEYVPEYNVPNCTSLANMFTSCYSLKKIKMPISSSTNPNSFSMSSMFSNCTSLEEVTISSSISTACANSTVAMFGACRMLTTAPLMNTSKVTNMSGMFNGCSQLRSVPTYITSSVTNFSSIFQNCSKILKIPDFDTSRVTDFQNAFAGCSNLIVAPSVNTINALNMSNMLTGVDIIEYIPAYDTRNCGITGVFTSGVGPPQGVRKIDASLRGGNLNFFYSRVNREGWNIIISRMADRTSKLVASAFHTPASGSATYVTSGPHGFVTGHLVTITGASPTAYNIGGKVNSIVNASTFTIASTTASGTYTTGGLITASPIGSTITITGGVNSMYIDNVVINSCSSIAGSNVILVPSSSSADALSLPAKAFPQSMGTLSYVPAVTFTSPGDTVTLANHGLSASTDIFFPTVTTTTGITASVKYYVLNPTASTFQVSATPGGSAIPMLVSGTGNLIRRVEVASVSANGASITLTTAASATGSFNLNWRRMNWYDGIMKGYTLA